MSQYILDGKTVVSCSNIRDWVEWFAKAERCVATETMGSVRISTVFLGLDSSLSNDGPRFCLRRWFLVVTLMAPRLAVPHGIRLRKCIS